MCATLQRAAQQNNKQTGPSCPVPRGMPRRGPRNARFQRSADIAAIVISSGGMVVGNGKWVQAGVVVV